MGKEKFFLGLPETNKTKGRERKQDKGKTGKAKNPPFSLYYTRIHKGKSGRKAREITRFFFILRL